MSLIYYLGNNLLGNAGAKYLAKGDLPFLEMLDIRTFQFIQCIAKFIVKDLRS